MVGTDLNIRLKFLNLFAPNALEMINMHSVVSTYKMSAVLIGEACKKEYAEKKFKFS